MSKKLKQKRAAQASVARGQFELYKEYIVRELVENFGGSYQTPESMKNIWRTAFVYKPECEKFLIKKTNLFIFLMSGENNTTQGPVFFKTLINLISEYLAAYISKKGVPYDDCTKELTKYFFDKNSHVQSTIKNYIAEKQKIWIAKQKEEHARKEIQKKHRKLIAFKISIEEFIR